VALLLPPMSLVGLAAAGAQVAPHTSSTAAGTYVALNPARIADTRLGSGYSDAGETLGSAGSINVQITGSGGVPVDDVSAAVLNVTVVGPTAASYLTVFPEGATQPPVSNLNFSANEILANLVTVPLGNQGGVTIFNGTGSTDVIVDLEGYYTSAPELNGLYNPVDPFRVLGNPAAGVTVGTGVSTPVTVAGVGGVPNAVSAVVVNVTVAGSTGPGYMTVYPAPDSGSPSPPPTSNVSFSTGQVVSNRVIVPVGANGQIEVYGTTSVSVDLDLDGYYTASAGQLGSAFTPLAPTRFTDTRIPLNGTPISSDSIQSFNFASDDIPAKAVALASNVTVISGGGGGALTIFSATDYRPPVASDINFGASAISQDFTQAPLTSATTEVLSNSPDTVNIIIDAFGYFSPPPRTVFVAAASTNLPADGASMTALTIIVSTGSGASINDPVFLSSTPSIAGSCGIASRPGSTNASSQATSTYTASTTPGSCTITAMEADGGATGSITLTQTAAAPAVPSQTDVAPLICAVVGGPASISSNSPGLAVCCVNSPQARKCSAARRR
jgi:hypothetical protein